MRPTVARSRSPASPLLALTLGAGLLLAAAGTAQAGWNGSQEIGLGDRVFAEFAGESFETHQFFFYAPEGTRVSAVLSAGRRTDLIPELKLFDEFGNEIDLGTALAGGRLRNFVLPGSGEYYFQVTAQSGTGEYRFLTRARFPSGERVRGTQDLEYGFEAVGGTTALGVIRPSRRSPARPVFDGLVGPEGEVDLGAPASRFRVLLSEDGAYDLSWVNNGADGPMDLLLRLRSPRSRRIFSFGAMEEPDPVPNMDAWMGSPHADRTAEAFNHWNEDGEVSTSCARCHSTPGYRDYIGADGTEAFVVDNAAPIGTTIECTACHNDAATDLDTVIFPSGETVTDLGPEARCMTCHQGRESTVSVNDHIASAGVESDDQVSGSIRFRNIHYFAAGVTLYGSQAKGAYQYSGKLYDGLNPHVDARNTCVECHDPHTTKLRLSECATCHTNVDAQDEEAGYADLRDIRMEGSYRDFDGDGNTGEGMYYELETMAGVLYSAMREYAFDVTGTGIVYDSHSYPYFFADANNNGVRDAGEGSFSSWTARLLRAAYNYQYWQKDPGTYAHNPRYMIACLYDSIEDLDSHEDVTVTELQDMNRNDSGHFDGTAEAYRHWDAEDDPFNTERGDVSSGCARCHSPGGFEFRAEYGLDPTVGYPVSDGLRCESCHVGGDFGETSPARKFIAEVTFPGDVNTIENDPENPDDSFICMTCHQGRESTKTVNDRIAANSFGFRNVHYLPAGGTIYGTEAQVAYEFDGKTYEGKWNHWGGTSAQCTYCHGEDHSFEPQITSVCQACHGSTFSDRIQRDADYDSDAGTVALEDEVHAYADRLIAGIRAYTVTNELPQIIYNPDRYPYWFVDDDGDGVLDPEDTTRYASWDAPLMRGAFNYQYSQKEHGAWAHNTHYILQILWDSIEHMGGDTSGLTRPTTAE